jgi:hypothetical protein
VPVSLHADLLGRALVTLGGAAAGALAGGVLALLRPAGGFLVSAVAGLIGSLVGLTVGVAASFYRLTKVSDIGAVSFGIGEVVVLVFVVAGVGALVYFGFSHVPFWSLHRRLAPVVAAASAAAILTYWTQ